jgi:hypothetical protein
VFTISGGKGIMSTISLALKRGFCNLFVRSLVPGLWEKAQVSLRLLMLMFIFVKIGEFLLVFCSIGCFGERLVVLWWSWYFGAVFPVC